MVMMETRVIILRDELPLLCGVRCTDGDGKKPCAMSRLMRRLTFLQNRAAESLYLNWIK